MGALWDMRGTFVTQLRVGTVVQGVVKSKSKSKLLKLVDGYISG